MKWRSTTNNERVLMAKTMVFQAEKHFEKLAPAGLTQEKLDEMKKMIRDVELQRWEQFKLKGQYH